MNKSVALATESPRLGKPRHPPLTRGALVCASILPGNETRKIQDTKNLLQPLVAAGFHYAMRFATMTRRPLVWEYSQVDRQMSLSP